MKSKEEFIKNLRSNELYNSALSMAKTNDERAQIIAVTEEFVSNFSEVLCQIADKVKTDDKFKEELFKKLKEF